MNTEATSTVTAGGDGRDDRNVSCEGVARVAKMDLEDVKKAVYGSERVTV